MRFRERGLEGLGTDYHRRKPPLDSAVAEVRETALGLRRRNPGWGAGRIRQALADQRPQLGCPGERTLQRWLRSAGLAPAAPGRRGVMAYSDDATGPSVRKSDDQWMLAVLQGKEPLEEIRLKVGSIEETDALVDAVLSGGLRTRNKALAILSRHRGIPIPAIARFLHLGSRTVSVYCRTFRTYGHKRLSAGFYPRSSRADDLRLQETLFAVLHTPPSAYDINRTTWRVADLRRVIGEKGLKACPQVIRKILRSAGYTWRKARVALTSHDPQYREKLAKLQSILSSLGPNERFFSIDEFGPFAVKM